MLYIYIFLNNLSYNTIEFCTYLKERFKFKTKCPLCRHYVETHEIDG